MRFNIPEYIQKIQPYKPGKPIEELAREHGIQRAVKLASNENPLGPSPKAIQAITLALSGLHRYPDGRGHELVVKLSERFGITPEHFVLGNGSDDLIGMLTRALLQPGDEVIIPTPSFLMYDINVQSVGAVTVPIPLKSMTIPLEDILFNVTPRTRMIFLCNPNNPTGSIISRKNFESFLNKLSADIVVIVDEAYMEFVRDPDCVESAEYVGSDRPIVTLRTFSKAYGLAGLRIGYGIMPPELAGLVHRIRQPFNASLLAQAGAIGALEDEDFLEKTIRTVHDGLDYLYMEFDKIGIRYFPTHANFFLIDVRQNADWVFEAMLKTGVIVRSMSSYGYPTYIRVNTGLPEENRLLVQSLKQVL